MKLKETTKNGVVAWGSAANTATCIAVGNWAGSTTDFASVSKSNLEIFSLELDSTGQQLESLGKAESADAFWRLSWGAHGKGTNGKGIIAAATSSGHIDLWDVGKIIDHAEQPLVKSLDKHTGMARTVQFNPFQSHLLGSGGGNGEIFMFDVTNTANPTVFTPCNRNQNCVNISSLAWSLKYEHILAATCVEGWTSVWDLRQKRVAVQFPNEGKRLSTVLWHPEDSMQLAVACENDDPNHAVLQIWDLRSAFSPRVQLAGHQRGIVSASWCPHDSSLLVSCGRDNRTLCWNPDTGELIHELPSSWNFDVQWSPRLPAVLSVSALGPPPTVSVHSLHDAAVRSGESIRPPRWLRKPCGVSFGFGGSMFSFDEKSSTVQVTQVVSDQVLVERSQKLESAVVANTLSGFCDEKAQQATTTQNKQIWSVLKAMFEPDVRKQLLATFGLSEEAARSRIEQSRSKVQSPSSNSSADITDTMLLSESRGLSQEEVDSLVKDALLIGSTELAVDFLMENGRTSDALVLAASADPALWEKVKLRYLQTNKTVTPFKRLLCGLLTPDFDDLIEASTASNWSETLAVLVTYAPQTDLPRFFDALGAKMELIGETHAAHLCFICASNPKVIHLWLAALNEETTHEDLIETMERITVLQKTFPQGTPTSDFGPAASQHFCRYAELLASQGIFLTAMNLLNGISTNPDTATEVAILRERIFYCRPHLFGEQFNQPAPTQTPLQSESQLRSLGPASPVPSQLQPQHTSAAANVPAISVTHAPTQPTPTAVFTPAVPASSGPSHVTPSLPTPPVPVSTPTTSFGPGQTMLDVVDVAQVADALPVILSLRRCCSHLIQTITNPTEKRKLDFAIQRLADLFALLNSHLCTPTTIEGLKALSAALDQGDLATAVQIREHITTTDANERKALSGLKYVLDMMRT
eukprot:c4964_g1_i1.p1 GENE.c4964_g1_i1~~c4964_g1_i1.p1  ORF type:complete len:924 (+),score=204.29 c4964_g1_i1:65-2836(+)